MKPPTPSSAQEGLAPLRRGFLLCPGYAPADSTLRRGRLNMGQCPPVSTSPAYRPLPIAPPSGANWIHEIKHDGYRLMARRDPVGIRLVTRRGNDWTTRFPLVLEAVNHLKVRSCLIDGEVVCCDDRGLAVFQALRRRQNEARPFLFAFDLLGRDGPAPRVNRGAQGDTSEHPAEEPPRDTSE